MAEEIYKRLAKHLDSLPGGFPATESGVELKILKKLFTPEEAEIAVHATLIPEEARVIARRVGWPVKRAEEVLARMGRTGLLFLIEMKGKPPLYMAAQYVIGIWEYHVNTLDEELVRLMNEYIPTLMNKEAWKASPQLRTIPVGKSVEVRHHVMPYEEAGELVRQSKRILVAPCICRKEHQLLGKGCDKPMETCLIFGGAAVDYYQKNGIGRVISQEEASKILEDADKAGLVIQPSNSQKIINICLCCGCCCQILIGIKRMGRPAEYVSSAFVAKYDAEKCIGCGLCVKRCQMDAFKMEEKKAVYDASRCIGCGLCVTKCPSEALVLERKPEQPRVPARFTEALMAHGRARGKLKPASLAFTALRSKLDRLLASGKS